MAWDRDSRQQILERAYSNIDTRLPGGDARLPGSNLNVLAFLHSEGVYSLQGYMAWIARQIDPRTCDAENVLRFSSLVLEEGQKPAAAATGPVQFVGPNGSVVPAGSSMVRSDGAQYITLAEGLIAGGVALINAQAVTPGQAGNTAAGATLTASPPIPGINSQVVVQAPGLSGGADVEDVESVRARWIERLQEPPHGGSLDDYERWAKEVPGVTRAWARPWYSGPGTVGILFVRDDDASIIPDAGEVAAVQAYIHHPSRAPVATKGVNAFAPVGVALNLSIQLQIEISQGIKDAVEAEIKELLKQESSPGATILISHIREAISRAAGEVDHVLTVPSANVTHTAAQMAIPGVITWL